MIVGLITSATYSEQLRAQFLSGLRSNGWEGDETASNPLTVNILTFQASGNYDDSEGAQKKQLYRAMEQWNSSQAIRLIVAVGGLVAAHGAFKKCLNKPFVALYGTTPDFAIDTNPNFCGGVNLDLTSRNAGRNNKLATQFGLKPEEICLLWNKNSRMGKDEKKAWVNSGWNLQKRVNDNTKRSISNVIQDIVDDNLATGVVVSGDPYFTSKMDTLVAAANASKLKFCYPFPFYQDAFPEPEAGSGICYGPDLLNAYFVMGQKAGTILTAINHNQPIPDTGVYAAPTGTAIILKGKARKTIAKKKNARKKKKVARKKK